MTTENLPTPEAAALQAVPLLPDDGPGPEREFTVKARTQGQMVRRRFLRHRGAMASLVVLVGIVLLAFTSIGIGPIPGWWPQDYLATGPSVDGGRPTLDVLPSFVDGDGLAVGPHPFGQENTGRDYFAMTMRGTQQSLFIALTAGIVVVVMGTLVGATAGYFGGRVGDALMRITDLTITLPTVVIASVIGYAFGGAGVGVLALVLGLILWTSLARLIRGEVLSLREKEFVEAARAMGAGPWRIIGRHMLPNVIGIILVSGTLTVSLAILLESALSFLGVGVRPPDISLGNLISTNQSAFQTRPWLFWWPGVFIIGIALTVNFIGDGLRDAFDPRQNRVRR
jgi:peptide/nickel transport system permease protein